MIFHQPGNSQGNFNFNAYTYRDKEYAPHFHKNLELMIPLEGSVCAVINGKRYTAGEGEMLLVLSNQIHSFQVGPDAKLWVTVFSEEYVPQFAALVKGMQADTPVFSPDDGVRTLVLSKLVDSECSLMMKKGCFYAVCDAFLSAVTLEPRQEKTSFLVGQLLDWISLHYTEDITLWQAAQLLGYEYHYLSRLLNKSYGISFSRLLTNYRLEHAIRLLQNTELPMNEIIEQSGFQSIRSFNHAFKNLTGHTPNDHRRIDKIRILR